MNRTICMQHAKRLALGLAVLALAATPSFAAELAAVPAEWSPDGGTTQVPMWGFIEVADAANYACPTGPVAWDAAVISVTTAGPLTINLKNCLADDISLFIPGLAKAAADPLAPQTATDGQGRERLTSFDKTVASGVTAGFSWDATEGTYLVQSGADVRTQVPMGLYGALVVGGTAQDRVLIFSEIDPDLNNGIYTGGARVSNWNPQYFLINGRTAPGVADIGINLSQDTRLRFVNAGLETFVPTLDGGLYMDVIAEDGNLYPYPLRQYGLELQAGKTYDAIVNAGSAGTYAIYDRALHLANGGLLARIQATPAAAAPTAVADSYSVDEDGTLTADGVLTNPAGVLANDTGDAFAAELVGDVSSGTLSLAADGTFTYTPDPDFFGSDQFTYVANDGAGGPNSNLATVTITVAGTPDQPVAAADAYDAIEGEVLMVAAPGVLGNDTNVDGDALTAAAVGTPAGLILYADGSFDYTPAGTAGAIETFDYQACNTSALCSAATVTINVVSAPTPVNNPPIANEDTFSRSRGATATVHNIIANDDDGEGNFGSPWIDGTSVVITTGTTTQRGGTVVNNGDGTITYTPPRQSFRGTDMFLYTVEDDPNGIPGDHDGLVSNEATARINVTK